MPLCAFNESIIQKHLCPLADLPIEFVQLVVRQIIPAMLFDAERQHMTQLFSAFIRHLALSSSNEIIVYARHKYSMNRLRSAVSEKWQHAGMNLRPALPSEETPTDCAISRKSASSARPFLPVSSAQSTSKRDCLYPCFPP